MAEKYHMIEYIHEDPEALQRTLQDNEAGVDKVIGRVRKDSLQRVVVTGVGSSYTAAVMAAPAFQYHSPLPTYVFPATELGRYAPRLVNRDTLVVVVSRSGERGHVVNAIKHCVGRGAFAVAVTGVADSLLAQNAMFTLVTKEGPEITFPKTKSVIACAGLLMRLGLALAGESDAEAPARLRALNAMPRTMQRTINTVEPGVRKVIPALQAREPVFVVGSGSNYGAALEGALKIQETAYIQTVANYSGEAVQGPPGAFNDKWLIVPLITAQDLTLAKELLRLVRAFRAHSLCISEPNLDLEGLGDHVLALPEAVDPMLSALVYLPPLQLLTYYWAVARGKNPDAPSSMRAILDTILPPGREEPELR